MTKTERVICEKMMNHAIICAEQAKGSYNRYIELLEKSNNIDAEIALRKGDQLYGGAVEIHQVLVQIGFKHEGMKVLDSLI